MSFEGPVGALVRELVDSGAWVALMLARVAAEEDGAELEALAVDLEAAEAALQSVHARATTMIGRRADAGLPVGAVLPSVADRASELAPGPAASRPGGVRSLLLDLLPERAAATARSTRSKGKQQTGRDRHAWKRVVIVERFETGMPWALLFGSRAAAWTPAMTTQSCHWIADHLAAVAVLEKIEPSGAWADIKKRWRKMTVEVLAERFPVAQNDTVRAQL